MSNSLVPATDFSSATRSRNAFINFLNSYRVQQQRAGSRLPPWVIACDAADIWAKMPLIDKYVFIEAARNTCYVYKSRDRRMNSVMRHIRKAVNKDEKCDLIQLSAAVKKMVLWKRRVLQTICYDADI